MNDRGVQRNRFARGAERRRAPRAAAPDRRRSTADRRSSDLQGLTLFRGADLDLVLQAIGECEVIAVPAGTELMRPGEANDAIYLLLGGSVGAYLESTPVDDNAIAIHPGECIGELSAIDGKPASALVIARTDARLLRLPRELFWDRLMAIPAFGRNLLVALAERMRRSNEAMLEAQRRRLELKFLQQELDVARQLQAAMLPLRRPLFPERTDIEAAGIMLPASSIGGDLFDAFFVDEGRLFVCVGDVSGHGVPAALFMARAVGLMHLAAMGTERPERLLARINDELCNGNDGSMFLTLFCAFFEVASGRLVYSNAGHCPPIVLRRSAPAPLPLPKGTLAGVVRGMRYTAREIVLERGETLLCFTDGVIEARNRAGEQFADARLLACVARHCGSAVETLLDAVRDDVTAFTGHAQFDDDFTLLAVRRPD